MKILLLCLLIISCDTTVNYDIQSLKEKEITMIKPVKEFPVYWKAESGTIWGIGDSYPEVSPEIVKIENEEGSEANVKLFFREEGSIFIKISISKEITNDEGEKEVVEEFHYFKQDNGVVEIVEGQFPECPDSIHLVKKFDGYQLTTEDYNGQTISRVAMDFNPAGDEIFLMVDNAYRGEHGLLMSVIEGRGKARAPGLWFWPYGKTVLQQVKGVGRLW